MSIFDSYSNSSFPTNFLEYCEGDIKFADIKPGDTLYVHQMGTTELNIKEVKLKSNVIVNKKQHEAYLSIEPTPRYEGQKKYYWDTKLIIGPIVGASLIKFDNELKEYDFNKIGQSSICVNPSNLFIFGTNKESVIRFAVMGIKSRINKYYDEINNTQKVIENLEKMIYDNFPSI